MTMAGYAVIAPWPRALVSPRRFVRGLGCRGVGRLVGRRSRGAAGQSCCEARVAVDRSCDVAARALLGQPQLAAVSRGGVQRQRKAAVRTRSRGHCRGLPDGLQPAVRAQLSYGGGKGTLLSATCCRGAQRDTGAFGGVGRHRADVALGRDVDGDLVDEREQLLEAAQLKGPLHPRGSLEDEQPRAGAAVGLEDDVQPAAVDEGELAQVEHDHCSVAVRGVVEFALEHVRRREIKISAYGDRERVSVVPTAHRQRRSSTQRLRALVAGLRHVTLVAGDAEHGSGAPRR